MNLEHGERSELESSVYTLIFKVMGLGISKDWKVKMLRSKPWGTLSLEGRSQQKKAARTRL